MAPGGARPSSLRALVVAGTGAGVAGDSLAHSALQFEHRGDGMLAIVTHRAGAVRRPGPIRIVQRDGIILVAAHDGGVGLIGVDASEIDHVAGGVVGPAALAGLHRHESQEPFRRAHQFVSLAHLRR